MGASDRMLALPAGATIAAGEDKAGGGGKMGGVGELHPLAGFV